MPTNRTKKIIDTEKKICELYKLISTEDLQGQESLYNDFQFFNTLDKAIKKESNPFYKGMLLFYKSAIASWKSMFVALHPSKQEGLDPETFSLQVIGEKMQAASAMLIDIKTNFPEPWLQLLQSSEAVLITILSFFHQNALHENVWQLTKPLALLMHDITDPTPPMRAEEIFYLPLTEAITFITNITEAKGEDSSEAVAHDLSTLQHVLAKKTNMLAKIAATFEMVGNCEDAQVAVDGLAALELPLEYPQGLLPATIQLIQAYLAFGLISSLLEKKHDPEFLLYHIDRFAQLGYFANCMRVEQNLPAELATIRTLLNLINQLRSLADTLLPNEGKIWRMVKRRFDLCTVVVSCITTDMITSAPLLEDLAKLACDAIEISNHADTHFINQKEECLFYLRPLQILLAQANKHKELLNPHFLPHFGNKAITLLVQNAWSHLDPADQVSFIHLTAKVFEIWQPDIRDANFSKTTDWLIVQLCQENRLDKAFLLLNARTTINPMSGLQNTVCKFDMGLLYLLRFLYFLPKGDILETSIPAALEKYATTFNNAIKHGLPSKSLSKLALHTYLENISVLSSEFLEQQFPGLIASLKETFFSKTQFFKFQMRYYNFLFHHTDGEKKSTEHLAFRKILQHTAQLLDPLQVDSVNALLHPSIQSVGMLEYKSEECKPIIPNLALAMEELRAGKLFTGFREKEIALSVIAVKPIESNALSLLACCRFYSDTKQRHENEFLTILLLSIVDLLQLPLNRVPTFLEEQIDNIIAESTEEAKKAQPTGIIDPKAMQAMQIMATHLKGMPRSLVTGLEFKRRDTSQGPEVTEQLGSQISEVMLSDNHIAQATLLIEKISDMLAQCQGQSDVITYLRNRGNRGLAVQALRRYLFFRMVHELKWPADVHSQHLMEFLLAGEKTPTEEVFFKYVATLLTSPFSSAGYLEIPSSDNPFLKAYREIVTQTKIGNAPLARLDYSGIASEEKYFVLWDKLYRAILFLKKQVWIPFKKEKLTTQLKNLAKAEYFLDCASEDASSHLLSFLRVWKKHVVTLKINYDFLQLQHGSGRIRLLDLTDATSTINVASMLWFENLKTEALLPEHRMFVFNNASDYLTGRLKSPMQDKKGFFYLLLQVCLEARKDDAVLQRFTASHFNGFLDLLVNERMFEEALKLLNCYINSATPNNPIAAVDLRLYRDLAVVLAYAQCAGAGLVLSAKHEILQSLNALTDKFLQQKFVHITRAGLTTLTDGTFTINPGADKKPDQPNPKKKKKKKKKSSEAKEINVAPTEAAAIMPLEQDPTPLLVQATELVIPEPVALEDAQAMSIPMPALSSTQPVPEEAAPIVPATHTTTAVIEASKPASPRAETFAPPPPDSRTLQEEQKKLSPARFDNRLFAQPKSPVASVITPTLVVAKHITASLIPASLQDLMDSLSAIDVACYVALVGSSLVNMMFNAIQPAHFAKMQLIIIASDLSGNYLLESFYNALCNAHPSCRITPQKKIALSLNEGEHRFHVVIEVVSQPLEENHRVTLEKYLQKKVWNLEKICLIRPDALEKMFELQATQETLSSLTNKKIVRHNVNSLTPQEKFIALLELAGYELDFPKFARDMALDDVSIEDLPIGFASLVAHHYNLGDNKLTAAFESLFLWRDVTQCVNKINELPLIHAMTGVGVGKIAETVSVLQSDKGIFDIYSKIKDICLFLYINFCCVFRDGLAKNPLLLQNSALRLFVVANLRPKDYPKLTAIEASVLHGKIITDSGEMEDFSIKLHAMNAHHLAREQSAPPASGSRYILWHTAPEPIESKHQGIAFQP